MILIVMLLRCVFDIVLLVRVLESMLLGLNGFVDNEMREEYIG